jgi:acyl-CoA synthetase (AMP-forming)/AMP-acid ligase II
VRPIDYLYTGAARDRSAFALETDGARVSYAQLVAEVEALAAAFQAIDPAAGSRVGICAWNTREHVTALLATYAAGKVWVPLNPRNGRAELDAMIGAARPSLIVADESCTERFTAAGIPVVLGHVASEGTPRESVRSLAGRFAGRRPVRVDRSPEDTQVIKFTGGTTGQPRGVLQPVRCIDAQARGIAHVFDFRADDRNLVAAPLTHGTSCFVLPLLAAGGTLVLPGKPTPAQVLDAFVTGRITTVYLPPTFIYAIMAEPGADRRACPALRHLIYSAAPMPPDRIRDARRVFGPVIETAYGQVEAPQIVTAMRAREFEDERNLASVGRATPVARVEVMDDRGRILPPGDVGEVVVQGDLVMSGYLDRPDLTAATIVDGWLHTGDLGFLDERGYLYLRSRLRDVIISGGFNVFPADVEAALSRHPAVAECSVFGVEDDRWGEAVHAAVCLRAGAVTTEPELIAFVKTALDSVKAPKRIHLLAELPRSSVGKVSRRAVRDLVLSRRGADAGQ